ncbi:dienelactone hydrolase family protein [Methylotenera versatilis]|uniref:Carboxymethylenebutenolidase n=1 Tax=Methylotenera versatilis (strain 301) TaxID=666681 RepID=D7DMR8_METV0|nr:dienelactone hydrolase family protein [Methylotenera versatilis]ADI30845.1 Carboxymethylenebutenolidase [Methylotenera versatilis 301]
MSKYKQEYKANDFDPQVLSLFDQYVHGDLDRRGFLKNVAKYAAIGGMTATGLLSALSPKFAYAQQVSQNDVRLQAKYVEFDSPLGYGKGRGYLVRPTKSASNLPVVLVVHENRGLNPHIEDIARRLALENYIAFAPDALFPLGGYPGDEDKARELFPKLDQSKTREDFVAALNFVKKSPNNNGKSGVVGFCYGGTIANQLATLAPDLSAAVPFYGTSPSVEKVPNIKAKLLLHFAEKDERVNATWPNYEAALKASNIEYEAHIYKGVQHGFNNDTTPRYEEAAAKLAWQRTIAFFNQTLKT